MKNLTLLLSVIFLFSNLSFAKGNNYNGEKTTTKSWYGGRKTVTTGVGGKYVNATSVTKYYKDGSCKYEYTTKDGQTRTYGTHK